jgi:Mannosyl-glycoprotein endo-beta-N-acetylglucosaminidase
MNKFRRNALVINAIKYKIKHFLFPAMIRFIKTNWFLIGVLCLVLAAICRKNLQFHFGKKAPEQPERFIDAGGPATLSIFGTGDHHQPMPDIEKSVSIPFLQRFGKVTKAEQEKFGVPASAMLALAYVNSMSGTRPLAREANNFYAIPCGANWQGDTFVLGSACYRQYETPWHGFREMSKLLEDQTWYAAAKKSAGKDWEKWVDLFAEHGCSDITDAAAEMKKVVKAYRLFELDGLE